MICAWSCLGSGLKTVVQTGKSSKTWTRHWEHEFWDVASKQGGVDRESPRFWHPGTLFSGHYHFLSINSIWKPWDALYTFTMKWSEKMPKPECCLREAPIKLINQPGQLGCQTRAWKGTRKWSWDAMTDREVDKRFLLSLWCHQVQFMLESSDQVVHLCDDFSVPLQPLVHLGEMLCYVTQHGKCSLMVWNGYFRHGFSFHLHKSSNFFLSSKIVWVQCSHSAILLSDWNGTSFNSSCTSFKKGWNWKVS